MLVSQKPSLGKFSLDFVPFGEAVGAEGGWRVGQCLQPHFFWGLFPLINPAVKIKNSSQPTSTG